MHILTSVLLSFYEHEKYFIKFFNSKTMPHWFIEYVGFFKKILTVVPEDAIKCNCR